MSWEYRYAMPDMMEWYNTEQSGHRLYLGKAADHRDHEWFGLPYIGELGPSDDRYEGPHRETFEGKAAALRWATRYKDNHPTGHSEDIPEKWYDAETGEFEEQTG